MKLSILLLFVCLSISSQAQYNKQLPKFVTAEIEGGALNTDYNSIIENSLINSEKLNFNIKATVSFLTELNDNILLEGGISQTFNHWNLSGTNGENDLKIKNRQNFPSGFIGGFYNFDLVEQLHSIYGGTKINVDFTNHSSLNDIDGSKSNNVVVSTEEGSKIGLNVTPEIGFRNYFKSGNTWNVSLKYNFPLSGDAVNGTAVQTVNNVVQETINFKSNGQYFAIGLKYGIVIN